MVVVPFQHIYMQCHSCRLAKALQSMVDHLRAQLSDLLVFESEIADEEGAGGNVNYGAGKGFVEGCVGVAEARDPFSVAERFGEGGTEG